MNRVFNEENLQWKYREDDVYDHEKFVDDDLFGYMNAKAAKTGIGSAQPRQTALDETRFLRCVEAGREVVAGLAADVLVCGEMGIANTTAAAAVSAALFGGPAEEWTGAWSDK